MNIWARRGCGTLAHFVHNESVTRGERTPLVFWSLLFVSLNCDDPDFTKRWGKKKKNLQK